MGSLSIIDDLMAPSDTAKITFKGANPFTVVAMIPDLIKNTMKISAKDLLETDVRWDATGENNDFYGVWMGKRTEDRWSKTIIRVIIQGVQNSKDKTGNFTMQIKGTLETKYEYSNFFSKQFWWFYNYQFYYNQRRKYLDNGKDDMLDMKEKILDRFDINQKEK
jgi:hypothetical protein